MPITSASSLSRRFTAYLSERFPPVVYTVLVALFHGSGVLVASRLGGVPLPAAWRLVAGGLVVWLAFFHLRVMDEHKDFARDRLSHPERLLSRGVVTLPLLARAGALAVLIEAVLAVALGPRALLAWALAFLFSVAMRYEFGAGPWLSRHILLYAITHNPIVAALVLFGWATTGAPWDPRFLAYLAAASLGSLAFELARKLHLPGEEIAGVDSYSSVHGRRRAGGLLAGVILLGGAAGAVLVWSFGPSTAAWVGTGLVALAAVPALILALRAAPSKQVEGAGSLFLLVLLLAMGVAAW